MLLRLALTAVLLAAPLAAHAQSTGTTPGLGSCTGMMTGTVGLAVPQDNNTFLSVNASLVTGSVFGAAECECAPTNQKPINAEIRLTTGLPTDVAQTALGQVWIGDSTCMNAQSRSQTNQTACKKLMDIDPKMFSSVQSSSGGVHFALPANFLTNPAQSSCDVAVAGPQASNSVWVFIYMDVNNPLATCTLNLTERLQPPDPVTNTAASGGDGAVTLTWTPPPLGTTAQNIQVLCSDDCGNPITDKIPTQIYSACVNGMLFRKDLTSGGSTSVGTDDGGVVSTDDLGASRIAPGGESTLARPSASPTANATPACAADMGTTGTTDMGANPALSAFLALDPRYICTSQAAVASTSTRIDGLNNFQTYHFLVLTIDNWGNTAVSPVIDATPQPTEDLWRRYRDAGGGGGGCFIATAAFGSYENRWVYVLRDFRDRVLLEHDGGRSFVEWYYAHSPRAADWIAEHGWARALTRVALAPVIAGAWFWLYVPPVQKALVITLLLGFLFRRRVLAAIRRTTA